MARWLALATEPLVGRKCEVKWVEGDDKVLTSLLDCNKLANEVVSGSMELGFVQVGLRKRRVAKGLVDWLD